MSSVEADSEGRTSAKTPWLLQGPSRVPYRVLLLGNQLGKVMDKVTAQHVRDSADLSLAQWRVLTHVEMIGTCSASEIANAALVDRAEVSRSVSTLEERGLLKREPNPRHRQSSLISFTEDGKVLYANVRSERVQLFEQWLSDLTEEQCASLENGLSTIMRRIIQSAPDAFDF